MQNQKTKTNSDRPIRGITAGAFDLCHYGHVQVFRECKDVCDYLIVAVQSDPSIDRGDEQSDYAKEAGKPKNKPIQSFEERIEMVKAIRYVDEVIPYDTEEDLYKILKRPEFDIRIIGADWKGKKFTGWDLPLKTHYNSRGHKLSTSELRQRVFEAEKRKQSQ